METYFMNQNVVNNFNTQQRYRFRPSSAQCLAGDVKTARCTNANIIILYIIIIITSH